MSVEIGLFAFVALLSAIPLFFAWARLRPGNALFGTALIALWCILPMAFVLAAMTHTESMVESAPVLDRPVEISTDNYVGSNTCRSCHPHEHSTWHDSWHRTMTQKATPQTVIGNFDHHVERAENMSFEMYTEDDKCWVDINAQTGPEYGNQIVRLKHEITMSTGSHHMQAYWFKLENFSRKQGMLPFIYLKEDQRWIPRDAAFLRPPDEEFFLSDETGRWSEGCIMCHATHGKLRTTLQFSADGPYYDDLDTSVAEFGISCEACHGPGKKHVAANRSFARRYQQHLGSEGDPTIVNPARLDHELSSFICGNCHSNMEFRTEQSWAAWYRDGKLFRPGEDLLNQSDRFLYKPDMDDPPERLTKMLDDVPHFYDYKFWSDGMLRVSGREFSGLIDSPCYQRGEMSCLSCHAMHQDLNDDRPVKEWANDQLHPGMHGNDACVNCHDSFRDPSVLQAHTHHELQSSGSDCMNCHMSYTTYGLLKAIRSHTIDSPSAATTANTGRINACNQCHLDKTLAWSAGHLEDWFGQQPPELSKDQQTTAESILQALRGDAGQRALMAWSFGWEEAQAASGTDWMAPWLAHLLEDPYDAVRYIAHRSLKTLDNFADTEYDFLADEADRSTTRQNINSQWQQSAHSGRSELLIKNDGQLQTDRVKELSQQRDDKPVRLLE